MRAIRFSVPTLGSESEATDLGNALTALSGVGSVSLDTASRTVSVHYDENFANSALIKQSIVGAGYPVEGDGVTE